MSFFHHPFKNLFHHPLKFLRNSLPTIGAVIGTATLGPGVGTAVGAGLGQTSEGLIKGQSIGDSLKGGALAGAGAYAGGQFGNFAGNALGDTVAGRTLQSSIGDTLSSAGSNIDPYLAQTASNALPASMAGASVGSVLGGGYGMQAAQNYMPAETPNLSGPTGPAPFSPKQQAQQDTPASLTGLGSLTDEQKSSNLATQGVYGGGNGPQEQSYFMNLLNRRLVDAGGHTSDLSKVSPIEQSYLSRLGLSGYGNTNSLLEAMSKWSPA